VEQAVALVAYLTQLGIQSENKQKVSEAVRGKECSDPLPAEALESYAALAKLVAPVSGNSVLDSARMDKITLPVRGTTLFILFFTALSAIIATWFGDLPEPEDGLWWWYYSGFRYILDFASPFLWGALGSCVYLLKRFSDLAEARVFERYSLQGWGTRILLGAVLGGVVQFIYDSSVFTGQGLRLDANALGFLAGVGVKVVYGGIEKTIAALAEAMNLQAIRTAPSRENAVRKFLADALASEEDPDRRKLIAELLDQVGQPPTGA
jgi:hypothetical protein